MQHAFPPEIEGLAPIVPKPGIPMQTAGWMAARARLDYVGKPKVLAVGPPDTPRATAMLCKTRFGLREMPLMNEPSDFAASDTAALEELVELFIRERKPFFLERLPEDSPTLAALRKAAKGKVMLRVQPALPTPFIDIRGKTLDDLVKSSRRSDLRRAERHLAAHGAVSYELRAATSKDDLDTLIDEAFDVETRSWKHDMGTALTSPGETTYATAFRGFIEAGHEEGHIRFAFVRLDGKPVAMQIASVWNNRYWIYKATFDKSCPKGAPGNLLYWYTLGQAVEQKLYSYEFMGGMDSWTRAWTENARQYVQVYGLPYNPRGLVGAMVLSRWMAKGWLKQRLRAREARR